MASAGGATIGDGAMAQELTTGKDDKLSLDLNEQHDPASDHSAGLMCSLQPPAFMTRFSRLRSFSSPVLVSALPDDETSPSSWKGSRIMTRVMGSGHGSGLYHNISQLVLVASSSTALRLTAL